MFKATEVAEYILSICMQQKKPISNLKLQKILYYVQGYYLALTDTKLFNEDIYAWRYGPVVPEVYNKYRGYAGGNIDSYSPIITDFEDQDSFIINYVIEKKIDIPVWELVEQTHEEMPWQKVYNLYGDKSLIPADYIKAYFKNCIGVEYELVTR